MKTTAVVYAVLSCSWFIFPCGCSSQYLPSPAVPPGDQIQESHAEQYDYAPKTLPDVSKRYIKKGIAVARFGDNISVTDSPFGQEVPAGGSAAQAGGVNIATVIGDASERSWLVPETASPLSLRFTEKLIHELHKTKRFVIVERKNINDVLRELNFQNSKYVSRETSERVGDVLGAQIIVTGAIGYSDENAEYWAKQAKEWILENQRLRVQLEKEGVINANAFMNTGTLSHDERRLLKREAQTRVEQLVDQYRIKRLNDQRNAYEEAPLPNSIYMRVYDAGTGRIVDSVRVEGRTEKYLLKKAVRKLVMSIDKVPVTWKIADVEGDIAYINAGRITGLEKGDEFVVFSLSNEIKDPDTGVVIGHREEQIGEIRVETVQDNVSKASVTRGAGKIKKGDLVKFKEPSV